MNSIFDVIRNGKLEAVNIFLATHGFNDLMLEASSTLTSPLRISILRISILRGDIEIVKAVLSKVTDIDIVDTSGFSALNTAAWRGSCEIAELLLDHHASINLIAGPYSTALISASFNSHLDVVKLLVNRGADMEIKNYNKGALASAAGKGNFAVVKFLIDSGCVVNVEDYQESALIYAIINNKPNIVQLLLKNGAKPDCQSSNHLSPLMRATYAKDTSMMKMLIDHGADMSVCKLGTNAFNIALLKIKSPSFEHAQLLIDHGVDVNALIINENLTITRTGESNIGNTALILAIEEKTINQVNFLIKNKADVNIAGYFGTPLMVAVKAGKEDIVNQLIANNAALNTTDIHGQTALHKAIVKSNGRITAALINAGADYTIGDNQKKTPLNLSRLKPNNPMTALIESMMLMNVAEESLLINQADKKLPSLSHARIRL